MTKFRLKPSADAYRQPAATPAVIAIHATGASSSRNFGNRDSGQHSGFDSGASSLPAPCCILRVYQ